MPNVSFTRDEVILALDTFYKAKEEKLSPKTASIMELSQLLRRLPIHSNSKRPENFRNSAGIYDQITHFSKGYVDDGKWNVGGTFFEVNADYKNKLIDVHAIAEAIKRNENYFSDCMYGADIEAEGFPEGALLGHLHRVIEMKQGKKHHIADRCMICQVQPNEIYKPCATMLMNHLLIPVTDTNPKENYTGECFITVCPNCHAALHRIRPWKGKKEIEDILR